MNKTQGRGFTITELLVVLVVIGVLVTITIFGFGAWRTRTAKTEVKSELTHIQTAIKNYRNFNNTYPAALSAIPYVTKNGITVTYTPYASDAGYCLSAYSTEATTGTWYIGTTGSTTPSTTAC